MINILGSFPIMIVDGSHSIAGYANTINLTNEMYTYSNAGHVPYVANAFYMDTTIRFVSNFLFRRLGCNPSDPEPVANTFPNSSIDDVSANSIKIFPNPSSGKIWIEKSFNQSEFEIAVRDVSGKAVFNNRTENNILNLDHFEPGIYFVEVISGNENVIKRIVLY